MSINAKVTHKPEVRVKIAEAVFDVKLQNEDLGSCKSYFDYYTSEIELLHAGFAYQTRQSSMLATQDHDDIFHVIHVLKENPGSKRPQIRQTLTPRFPHAGTVSLNRSINLAIRLWLMINVQDEEFSALRPGSTCVSWDDTTSLNDFVNTLFPNHMWQLNPTTSRLGPFFTAAFLYNICGLRPEWTTNLHDHLLLDRRRKTLKVFPFKCHIARLLSCHGSSHPPPVPRQLLRETLLSLELLFPIWDSDTNKLLAQEKQTFHISAPFSSRPMSLLDFNHWRDRLLELQEVLQSPPVSWAQLWRDRRNPQQFWTFWIALIILGLTIISTIAGIVQAWASVKALKATS